jgi:hypothetical protein
MRNLNERIEKLSQKIPNFIYKFDDELDQLLQRIDDLEKQNE